MESSTKSWLGFLLKLSVMCTLSSWFFIIYGFNSYFIFFYFALLIFITFVAYIQNFTVHRIRNYIILLFLPVIYCIYLIPAFGAGLVLAFVIGIVFGISLAIAHIMDYLLSYLRSRIFIIILVAVIALLFVGSLYVILKNFSAWSELGNMSTNEKAKEILTEDIPIKDKIEKLNSLYQYCESLTLKSDKYRCTYDITWEIHNKEFQLGYENKKGAKDRSITKLICDNPYFALFKEGMTREVTGDKCYYSIAVDKEQCSEIEEENMRNRCIRSFDCPENSYLIYDWTCSCNAGYKMNKEKHICEKI